MDYAVNLAELQYDFSVDRIAAKRRDLSSCTHKQGRYQPKETPCHRGSRLYLLRWQIELVFKRMKSILGVGHLSKKDPLSAQAWLEGKLFVGLLIELMVDAAGHFSPGATPWQPRRSRWREIEFMYRQVGAALLMPQSLTSVINQWPMISKLLAATPPSANSLPGALR